MYMSKHLTLKHLCFTVILISFYIIFFAELVLFYGYCYAPE